MNQSINYFFQEIPGVASDNCQLYFDFISGSNRNIIYNKSGNSNITGSILTGKEQLFFSGFWDRPDSGYFNSGKYVKIHNTTGINIQDFTTCFIYQNIKPGGSTLISTVGTGYIQSYTVNGSIKNNFVYKGFDFGITANNYLYFEYYNDDGPAIFIGNDNLSEKNSIFLSIKNNSLSFGYYDFFKEKLISYDYNINTSYLYDANEMFIGYNPKATGTYAFNNMFSGFIDELLIFSPSIYNYEIENLNSGFVHIFNSGTYYELIDNLVTGVTGYTSGVIGYENQITGNGFIITNELTGEFGEIYSGYTEVILTGLVPLSGLIELTGVISFDIISGYSDSNVIKNNDYIKSFGKNYINFLYENTSEDLIELNLTTNYTPGLLKNLDFDYAIYTNRFTLKDDLNLDDNYIIYTNGQLQQIGGFYFTGNGYESGKYIINDYIRENNSIYFANEYKENDIVIADYLYNLPIDNYIYRFRQKITGSKFGASEGQFGYSNAISNNENIIAVGGFGTSLGASGRVLIYTGNNVNGWNLKQILSGDGGADRFGSSVNINSGNIIIVGASNDNHALVFTGDSNSGWYFKQKLTGDASIQSNGTSVSINNDGSVLLMTAPLINTTFSNCGGAFIYTGNQTTNWNFKQKLTGTFTELRLGVSSAMSQNGNIIALGGHSNSFSNGQLFIYTGNSNAGWNLRQIISGNQGEALGCSVSMDQNGNIILIGAKGQDATSYGSGLIYVGDSINGWNLRQIISGESVGNFGQSVSITNNGNTILVYGKSDGIINTLIYTGNSTIGWNLKQNINNIISTSDTVTLHSSAIISKSGNVIIIGERFENANTGASYIYNLENNISYTVNDNFIINADNNFYILTGYASDIYSIYFNGIKLISGLHYNSNSLGYIQFNQNSFYYTGVSGKLTINKKFTDFTITGSGNLFKTNLYNFSEIYKNGVRQLLNDDYLELASIDSNTGQGFFDQKEDIIYNNII